MSDLSRQRCFNHASREAAARCLECQRFFCRECVTEHDDRVLCAACLKRLAKPGAARRLRWTRGLAQTGECALGILIAWMLFLLVGQGLLRAPSSFHDSALWPKAWWEEG